MWLNTRMTNKLLNKTQATTDNGTKLNNLAAESPQPTASPSLPQGITDFPGLVKAVPLSPRSLRTGIKEGIIPVIRLPGGRRLLFHLPSVEKALLRFQRGGME